MTGVAPMLLVVEDDALLRATLADALTDGGFQVLAAADAEAALALLCDRPEIAALLTDIDLPGAADGLTLARAARLVRPGLPVVYASGQEAALPAQRVAGAGFIAKPFTPMAAGVVIRDLIAAGPARLN